MQTKSRHDNNENNGEVYNMAGQENHKGKCRNYILVIAGLAVFNFLFLGTEYVFDNRMAELVSVDRVVWAQSIILTVSAAGFLIYPVLKRYRSGQAGVIMQLVSGVICMLSIWMMTGSRSEQSLMIWGCVFFLFAGMFGSKAHDLAAAILKNSSHMALMVGTAYAAGLLLQFINNNLVTDSRIQASVLLMFVVIFVVLLEHLRAENETEVQYNASIHPGITCGALVCCVLLMAFIFAALDNIVTYYHAKGTIDAGEWPRLLLVLSGILAGILFDLKKRRFMSLVMYCVTILSVIGILLIGMGGSILAGLIVFYLATGFFVVFFTTGFMEVSYYTRVPALWAGFGRAVNNIGAGIVGFISTMMPHAMSGNADGSGISGGLSPMLLASIVILVLFVMINIAMFIYSSQLQVNIIEECFEREGDMEGIIKETASAIAGSALDHASGKYDIGSKNVKEESDGMDTVDYYSQFAEEYRLTDREQDVLRELLESDESVQDIAEKLYISRTALYKHISSLNKKTDTRSRIGLIQFYYAWRKPNKDI